MYPEKITFDSFFMGKARAAGSELEPRIWWLAIFLGVEVFKKME